MGVTIHGVDLEPKSEPLSGLHQGHIEKPIAALGQQEVGGPAKGSAGVGGSRNPKGMGRSVAKAAMSKEKEKLSEDY